MKIQNIPAIRGANGVDSYEISEMEVLQGAQRARAEAIGNWLESISRAVDRWFTARFRRAHQRQRVIKELNALDERMLSDIGITRGDIPFVANGQSRVRKPGDGNDAAAA